MKTLKLCLIAPYIIKSQINKVCFMTVLISLTFGLLAHSTPLGVSVHTKAPIYNFDLEDLGSQTSLKNDSSYQTQVDKGISLNWPLGIWGTHMVLHSNISMTSVSSVKTGVGLSIQLPLELQPWNYPTWIKIYYDTQTSDQSTFNNWKDVPIPGQDNSVIDNNWNYLNLSVVGRTQTIPYVQKGFSLLWLLGVEIPSKKQTNDQIYVGEITPFYKWINWGVSLPLSVRVPKFKRDGNDVNTSTEFAVQRYFNDDWNIQVGVEYQNEIYERSIDPVLNRAIIYHRPAQISGSLELRYNLSDLTSSDPDLDQIENSIDCCPFLAEDYDGFEDADGCPDYDNDGDGIKDEFDKCPFNAEDFDLFEDEDGCPEVDNDKDQIFDSADACPLAPEDYDNFQDFDGCPDLDNDNDSIPDNLDQCKDQKEDFDQFQDLDGCPDLDNDKDNLLDSVDKCPLLAEDFDMYQDLDGCPDMDNDQDGILDSQDYCPNIKESFNGFADHDGCPDILKLKDTLFQGEVLFDKDRSTSDKAFLVSDIQKIIEIQNSHPDAYIQLTSRASQEGSQSYNLELSRKRSQFILNMLKTKAGWPIQNIYSVYLGEEFPIGNKEAGSFLEINRRTDITILER